MAPAKKLVLGIPFLVVLFGLTTYFGWNGSLSSVHGGLEDVIGLKTRCFQGVCTEFTSNSSFVSKWWLASIAYLQFMAPTITLALLAYSGAIAFLLPRVVESQIISGTKRFHSDTRLPGKIGFLQVTVPYFPALVFAAFVFPSMVWMSSLVMVVLSILLPEWFLRRADTLAGMNDEPSQETSKGLVSEVSWNRTIIETVRDLGQVSFRHLATITPAFFLSAFLAGAAIQLGMGNVLSVHLSDTVSGVVIAATLGAFLVLPPILGMILVTFLVVFGAGVAPVTVLLFASVFPGKGVAFRTIIKWFSRPLNNLSVVRTWFVAVIGGLLVMAVWNEGVEVTDATTQQSSLSVDIEEAAPGLRQELFINATLEAGIEFVHHAGDWQEDRVGAGVVVFDFNGDGLSDVYFPEFDGPNALYRNEGDGTFIEVAVRAGLDDPDNKGNGGCSADYDNDGDADLYLSNFGPSKLFRNDADGTFSDVTTEARLEHSLATLRSTGCSWGDFDKDGFLDLVVVRYAHRLSFEEMKLENYVSLVPSKSDVPMNMALGRLGLYRNNGDGTFADVTVNLGDKRDPGEDVWEGRIGNLWGAGFQPGWVDFDNDGDVDLYVVNDMGEMLHPNVLWRNDGSGRDGEWQFEDVSKLSGSDVAIDGMALAVGDYNLDGFLDFYMTNIGSAVLLKNSGDGLTFTKEAAITGTEIGFVGGQKRMTWGAMFLDHDNDGDEDLYVVSGLEFQRNVLLRNEGNGTFVDISSGSGADDPSWGHGAAFLDYNGDGCLDIVISNWDQPASVFRNKCQYKGNWLVVDTVGVVSNRDGIGARVKVEFENVRQIRQILSGGSQMGQNMLEAHFGIGAATKIDTVTVLWPSGKVQKLSDVPVNTRLVVQEPH